MSLPILLLALICIGLAVALGYTIGLTAGRVHGLSEACTVAAAIEDRLMERAESANDDGVLACLVDRSNGAGEVRIALHERAYAVRGG